VHRPKYDDWTFPKGKLKEGESPEDAALREVEEESGWRCELAHELEPTRYKDANGRAKVVHWWEMIARQRGPWQANDEVDEIAWMPLAEVDSFLTYESDRKLAAAVRELPPLHDRDDF
jgi:8-oxo-dGTP diphosphatase